MPLKTVYERFLASPNPLSLSEDVVLNYVTTLTAFKQQGTVIKHLENQNKNVVQKKVEKVVSHVEGQSSLVVVVETSLEFLSSGGAYLPGMDTFILGRIATLPITHTVSFDVDDKITQIRINWDQADLLKQVDVIGTRGRNWPIFEGKEQIKMISASSNSAVAVNPAVASSPRGRGRENGDAPSRGASPNKKHIRDPHASLDLFAREQEEERRPSDPNAVAPRMSAKPPPREMSELFAAGHEDLQDAPGSPSKYANQPVVAPKGAASRRFAPNRLFDTEEEPVKEAKIYKTNPARYNHFDLGDPDANDPMQYRSGNETTQKSVPLRAKTNKNLSQWDFKDFSTPDKVRGKIRDQDIVHFKMEDTDTDDKPRASQPGKPRRDNETHFEFQDEGRHVDRPAAQPKPRKDIESHFEFRDDPTPAPRRIIARTKAAEGIYSDPVFGDDGGEQKKPSGKSNTFKKNDFTSHWDLNDQNVNDENRPISKKSGRPGLESSWGMEQEPAKTKPAARNGRMAPQKDFWDF